VLGKAPMTSRTHELLRDALALPAEERADVAAELLASLEELASADEAAVEAAWAREIEQRAHRVLSGQSVGDRWEDVRERLARSLAKR
jgi:putative addiction module component